MLEIIYCLLPGGDGDYQEKGGSDQGIRK